MKKLSLALAFLVLLIGTTAFAAEIDDYQGTWVAKYLVRSGEQIPVEDVPIDVTMEIDGCSVTMTSAEMNTDHETVVFSEQNGRLEFDGGIIYYTLELNDDGTLMWSIISGEADVKVILEKQDDDGEDAIQDSGSDEGSLKKGDSGKEVKKLQKRLKELGYLDETEKYGVFGDAEEEAVKLFQSVYGYEETGVADDLLQSVLYDSGAMEAPTYAELKKGDRGDDVKKLQQRLIDLGWLDGGADGSFGGKTDEAVNKFQAAEGLPVTGVADGKTQRKLFSDNALDGRRYNGIAYPLADQGYVCEYDGHKVEVLGYDYVNWSYWHGGPSTPAVTVRFYFVNETSRPIYMLSSFGIRAFQDGVEMEYISLNGNTEEERNITKEIKDGAGIYCSMVFSLKSDSDAELIIMEPNWTENVLCDIPLKR